ncbi:DUF58 domain-containing protein [Sporosarcina sp. Marseille-Q4063]|uniref:DUF58 domain-containing protein n=1 Tax=Sporosarcina sp. Marseille-Q4063 TaxID=2810514 RepID=UPI001BAECCBA|nr:DUF58 domain-containing protein [Sporosarcina sp. Marseille-Q4063]QUW21730.1 DUF58 domain-containing protein [Sporosarcina sp. Marseille-Q4063]
MNEELFPNQLLSRLGGLSIATKSGRLGHHKGTHRSRKTGSSLDFSDFREYHMGDDIRHIDWNVYARTGQPFIKQYLDEQEMRIHIVLDSTKSMQVDGKWDYARKICVGLGHIALKSGDTVSVSTRVQGQSRFIRKKGVAQRAAVTKFLSSIEEPNSESGFTDNLLSYIPKALTVLFLVTDGLEETENWAHLFKRLRGICNDVRVILVQSESEELPSYEGDVRLVDIESDDGVEVTMTNRSIRQYIEAKEIHEGKLFALAKKYGIQIIHGKVHAGVMTLMTKRMRQVGWLE